MMQFLKPILGKAIQHKWLSLLVTTILIAAFPVACRTTRLLLLVFVIALWLWGAFLLRRRKIVAVLVLAVGVLLLAWLRLPGTSVDPATLRSSYVNCLKQYRGSLYVWGGENRIGIDCSGLVRRGFINANAKLGVLTFNPRLVRNALSLWWHDCSARALRDEFRGLTTQITTAPSINSLTRDAVLPGDLAVTENGVHVLAYLGGTTWIQADPDSMCVTMTDTPSDSKWFTVPVRVIRWSQMKGTPNNRVHDIRH